MILKRVGDFFKSFWYAADVISLNNGEEKKKAKQNPTQTNNNQTSTQNQQQPKQTQTTKPQLKTKPTTSAATTKQKISISKEVPPGLWDDVRDPAWVLGESQE